MSVLHQTQAWIEKFIIAYNLCPFAKVPFEKDQIRYVIIEGNNLENIIVQTFTECNFLLDTAPELVETSLIILPDALNDFYDYINVLNQMQDDLETLGLNGQVQFASFHPQYQFAGTDPDAPENFTNRSPFPMIHILRENSVQKAINLHPDTLEIPSKNIEVMNKIGIKGLNNLRNEIIGKN